MLQFMLQFKKRWLLLHTQKAFDPTERSYLHNTTKKDDQGN